MFTNLRWLFLLITFWPLSLITHFGWAQGISLPASGTYTETFDNLRAGLPAGWTVRRGASTNPPALGVSEPFATTPAAWSDAGASFKNVASADGLLQTATPTEQAASSDRALGVRQTPTFGDPGTAFTLQIAKTLGVSNIRLQFKIQSLDAAAARTTNWRVEYGLGESPAIYFQVGQSFTTGGNTRSNETINIDFGSKLNSNSGPIWIRIIANNASSGSGERPLTAIDDVVLTYQTSGFVLPASTNTISYAVGDGPATGDFSFQYYYPDTAPGSLTIISPNPSLFTISGDNVTFGSTVVVPYTTREPISVAIKVRLAAGLAAGAYSGDISVKGIGGSGDFLFFISGLVTQTTQPTFVTTISSLTGGNGFQNYVGFGPKVKFLTLLGANLTPVPGNYTITSSNPSAFRISTGFGTNGSNTVFYRSPNPPPQTIQVEFSGGLPAGEYTANLLIEGGGATPITVPLSGTVSVDDTPPVIRVTPTILPAFTTTRGIPSAPQTVTLTGTNFDSMAGQINITSPAGFEVALFGSSIYNPNPGVAPGAPGGNFALEIKVRMTGGDLGNYGGNLVFTNFGGGAAPVSVAVSGTVNPVGTSPLSVTALGYNCQTGAIQFGRLGGDANRAVEYEAIGVKSYSTNPNGVIEAEKRGDPNSGTTVTLKARYVGDPASEVTYTFDFGAYCRGTIPPNPADLKLIEPGYNCQTGAITFRTQGGDGTPIEYEAIGVKSYSTNPNGIIEAEKRGDPNSGTTVTLKARYVGNPASEVTYTFDFGAYCRGTIPPNTADLKLIEPGYNCQTGAITFRTQGGDGTPIEYEAIGVKSYSTNPNGVIEAEKRGDPNSGTTVTLKARYVGNPASEVTYTFDFGAYCRGTIPPNTADLKLIEPGYNCQTGAITFRTQGGDGTPIEYEAIGVKSYSTNPNGVIEAEKRGDPNSGTTVTLKARQSGKVVEYVFDFAAYCHTNGGRQAAAGRESTSLQVVVLGNPIGNELSVDISGIATNALQLRLTDVRGMIIEERNLMLTTDRIKQTFDVQHQQPGLLILQVMAGIEVKAVQVFKP